MSLILLLRVNYISYIKSVKDISTIVFSTKLEIVLRNAFICSLRMLIMKFNVFFSLFQVIFFSSLHDSPSNYGMIFIILLLNRIQGFSRVVYMYIV